MKESKRRLPFTNICISSGDIEKCAKYANEMADDVIHIGEVWNPVCCHGNKILSSYCEAPLVEPHCKESNIPVSNWLRYRFSSYLIKIWLSI